MNKLHLILFLEFLALGGFSQCNFDNEIVSICSGTEYNYEAPEGYLFSWGLPEVIPAGSVLGATTGNSEQVFSQTLSISNTAQSILSYLVVPEGAGCNSGSSFVVTLTIKPVPEVISVSNQTHCAGSFSDPVIFSSDIPEATFSNWLNDFPETGIPSTGSGNIESIGLINPFSLPITSTIRTRASFNGCLSELSEVCTITVKPLPQVFGGSTQSVCFGESSSEVSLTASLSGSEVNWVNSNPSIGLPASGSGMFIPSFVPINNGTEIVSAEITAIPTFEGCQGAGLVVLQINANPEPVVDPLTSQELCSGEWTSEIVFTSPIIGTTYSAWTNTNPQIGLSSSGVGDIMSFLVMNGSTEIIESQISITPSVYGCVGQPSEVILIQVKPSPETTGSPQYQLICGQATVSGLQAFATIPGSSIAWTTINPLLINIPPGAEGSLLEEFEVSANYSQGNLFGTIEAISTYEGCSGSPFLYTIEVMPNPSTGFEHLIPLCSGQDVEQQFLMSQLENASLSWWNESPNIILSASGSGTSIPAFSVVNESEEPIITFIDILVEADGNCSTSVQQQIEILPEGYINDVEFLYNIVGDSVCFTIQNGVGLSTTSWDFGDQTISDQMNVCHRYDSDGEYIVNLNVINACGNAASFSDTLFYSTVGIESHNYSDFKVFPNPVVDNLQIEFNYVFENEEFYMSIFDISGREIRSFESLKQSKVSIYLGDVDSGNYFLHLRNRRLSKTINLIKL